MDKKFSIAQWKEEFPDYASKIVGLKLVDEAFAGEKLPHNFYLPDELEAIGDKAFAKAHISSEKFNLPYSLKRIGKACFANAKMDGKFNLVIPSGVVEIPENCFSQLNYEGTLTLGDGLTTIKTNAFADSCLKLHEVLGLPQSLQVAEEGAFVKAKYIYDGKEYDSPFSSNVDFLRNWFLDPKEDY